MGRSIALEKLKTRGPFGISVTSQLSNKLLWIFSNLSFYKYGFPYIQHDAWLVYVCEETCFTYYIDQKEEVRGGKNVWYTWALGCEGGDFVALVQTELQDCSVFCVKHDTEQSLSLQYRWSCRVAKSPVWHMTEQRVSCYLATLCTWSLITNFLFCS